jgi:hypothetical protein
MYEAQYKCTSNSVIDEILRLSKLIARTNNDLDEHARRLKMKKTNTNEISVKITELKKELNGIKEDRKSYILCYMETDNGHEDGTISDTPRNNLARLEHLRWNTFYLIHGWTKYPKSKIGPGNKGRKDKYAKQHACITTYEELLNLRDLQASKVCERDPDALIKEAKEKSDTIWYDYNLMDELTSRLEATDKIIVLKRRKTNNSEQRGAS